MSDMGLTCLAEEAAEVIIEIMKAKRFGIDEPVPWHPASKYEKGSTPRSRLEIEIGDFLAALEYCLLDQTVNVEAIQAQRIKKFEKLIKMHGAPIDIQHSRPSSE